MAVQGTVVRNPWVGRLAAMSLIGVGLFLLKLCVLDVLSAAHRGEAVSLSMKGTILAPVAILLGAAATYAAFTRNDPRSWGQSLTHPSTRRLKPLGWVIALGVAGVGIGLYVWLRSQLTALGYEL